VPEEKPPDDMVNLQAARGAPRETHAAAPLAAKAALYARLNTGGHPPVV